MPPRRSRRSNRQDFGYGCACRAGPVFQATAAPAAASVYFTADTATAGGTITRTDGQLDHARVRGGRSGGDRRGRPTTRPRRRAGPDHRRDRDHVHAGAGGPGLRRGYGGDPETVTITLGVAPEPVAIQIAQINPVTVNATGLINITAAHNVFSISNVDVRLGPGDRGHDPGRLAHPDQGPGQHPGRPAAGADGSTCKAAIRAGGRRR